jgi:hypothetical protein
MVYQTTSFIRNQPFMEHINKNDPLNWLSQKIKPDQC